MSSSNHVKDRFFKHINMNEIIEPEAYEKCMKLLPLVMDNEASQEDTSYFTRQIKNWPWVGEYMESEKAFRSIFKSKLAYKLVPDGLADIIKEKIRGNS